MNEMDMLPNSPVKSLSLTCPHSSGGLVERILAHTPVLEHLSFKVVNVSEAFIECLSIQCPRLRSLEIELTHSDNSRYTLIEKLCYGLAQIYHGQLVQLKLCLHREPLVPQHALNEVWKSHGPFLKSLELSKFTVSPSCLFCLAQYISPKLKRLCLTSIMDVSRPPFDTWVHLLSKCGNSLQTLHLDKNFSLNDHIAFVIAKCCSKLRELSLRRTRIGDVAIKKILETNGKTLETLNLSETFISGDTIRNITKYCYRITDLDVEWPRWPEAYEGASSSTSELTDLICIHGSHLESLNVDRWPVTNDILESIATYGRSLKVLTIRDNKTLSDDHLRMIMQDCKKLQRLYILLSYPYTIEGLSYDVLTEVQNRYIDYHAELGGRALY
ncbi:UV-damaged DNA-binding protein rad7 [Basidiobolus ranarum]|uniref:UV-damaged DNA-binding protein rad7 n=1 Tax=Basidiobolus ranarum TaxID=34480 RepID=A0ABR2WTU6_9FUNG